MANMDEVQRKDANAITDGDKRNSFGMADGIEIAKGGVSDDADMQVYGHAEHVIYTDEENKRVLRKIDTTLLPMLCVCYIFSVRKRVDLQNNGLY